MGLQLVILSCLLDVYFLYNFTHKIIEKEVFITLENAKRP